MTIRAVVPGVETSERMPGKRAPSLEIDSLVKSYGQLVALDRMTFTLSPGEVFGFVGSNGAGKTTTMRVAAGVLAADSGEVRWDGRSVDQESRSEFGYMPEERGLYPKMTVARQLVYLARLHGKSRSEAVDAMRMWTAKLDIGAHRDRAIDSLSLGNQQRVQLAAALVHDPLVLLLDEPFSGLDPLGVDTMSAVLRDKAAEGVPVLFSSHQLELVERLCDRVGVVHKGSMVACGSVAELRGQSRPGLYLEVEDADPGWPARIPGVKSHRAEGRGVVVELRAGFGDEAAVTEAMAAGKLVTFRQHQPTLTELFRSYVTEATEGAKP